MQQFARICEYFQRVLKKYTKIMNFDALKHVGQIRPVSDINPNSNNKWLIVIVDVTS